MHFIRFVAAEREAVYRFAHLADELGHELPDDSFTGGHSFLLGEPEVIESPLLSEGGGADWVPARIVGLARHHGIPARLLDWTTNPMVAAMFAAGCESQRGENLAVWALRLPDQQDVIAGGEPHELCRLRVLVERLPRHVSPFLHAQAGLFTWIDQADRFFLLEDRWPTVNDVCDGRLQVISLPATQAEELLSLLRRAGITRAHLMPTLDNVAQAVRDTERPTGELPRPGSEGEAL